MLPIEHCPNCGDELEINAAILEQPVIEKVLFHLGGLPEYRGGCLLQNKGPAAA